MSGPIKVYYTNFGYWADFGGSTVYEAIKFSESKGFETTIYRNKHTVLGTWSPISGFKGTTQVHHGDGTITHEENK